MPNIDVITTSGEKRGSISLRTTKTPSPILISNVVLANLANKRRDSANTKTKGEVSGGGKKPWRQKGTGRARAGSTRSPIWVGGGITFGPRADRNFSKRVNQKQNLVVLNHLINQKANEGKLKIIEDFKLESSKTKELIRIISSWGIDNTTLIALDDDISTSETGEKIYLAGANIGFLKIINAKKLSAYLISKYKWLIITKKAIEDLNSKFDFIKEEKAEKKTPSKEKTEKIKKEE